MAPNSTRHLDFRDDSYRGTYWNPPQSPYTQALSPVGRESLRKEGLSRQTASGELAKDNAVKHSAGGPSFGLAPPSAGPSSIRSVRTHRTANTAGIPRSLPTQIADKPTTVNINHLRGGVRTYAPGTNVDNWVEERFDAHFAAPPGSPLAAPFAKAASQKGVKALAPRRLGPSWYASTAEATLSATWNQAYSTHGFSAESVSEPRFAGASDNRSISWQRPNYLNYGPKRASSTLESQGCYWVGVSPTDGPGGTTPGMYKSISSTTYGERALPEFQRRAKSSDPKARVLCTLTPGLAPADDELSAYRAKWFTPASAAHEKTWKSEYAGTF